jgi:tryptophan-rich sensory protein
MTWYKSLKLPKNAPSGPVIAQIWAVIYMLAALSALIFWNTNALAKNDPIFIIIAGNFLLNALLNVFWTYLFFQMHMIGYAFGESIALAFSVLTLILYIFPYSALASMLLLPYLIWICYAVYNNYLIWQMNSK